MCGIAGCFTIEEGDAPPSLEALTRMAASLHHRGPDEQGIYRDARVGLAHARLSIIDLSTGQQPMLSADEQAVICFNGEIFIKAAGSVLARSPSVRSPIAAACERMRAGSGS